MSKSAPATPPKFFQEPDFFEPRSKVRFNKMVSVRLINKPPYPEETYPWENTKLYSYNKEMVNKKNIDPDEEHSDSEEPKSPQSALDLSPNEYDFVEVRLSYDERKERSDDEESEPDSNSASDEEGTEVDEGDNGYEEGDEDDEGDCESYEYSESESESESELEDEYQVTKRYKLTKLPPLPFPDYAALTAEYEASRGNQEPQISYEAAAESGNKPIAPDHNGKRKQPIESRDCGIEAYQPNPKWS